MNEGIVDKKSDTVSSWGIVSMAIVAIVIVVVFSLTVIPMLNGEEPWDPFHQYWTAGSTPDGWYHQREGMYSGQYANIHNETDGTRTVWFAMCDHAYLGPLHGTFKLGPNVPMDLDGHYDIHVVNNIIVAVSKYA